MRVTHGVHLRGTTTIDGTVTLRDARIGALHIEDSAIRGRSPEPDVEGWSLTAERLASTAP